MSGLFCLEKCEWRVAYYNKGVKADSKNMISYASKQDYLARRPSASALGNMDLSSVEKVGKTESAQKGIEKAASAKEVNPKDLGEDVKETLKEVPKKVKDKVVEGKSAGSHLISQAGSAILRGVSNLGIPGISAPNIEVNTTKAPEKVAKVSEEPRLINKPGIFFIKGFSLNPFESEEDGLGAMAKNIPTSKVFSWSDEDAVIDEIKKRPHTQPVILVGHGMGGDTAVSIANKLNHIDHGFRRVDLLVTMDSIGSDNDIIPQNVRENYNLISDQDFFFNDGPNIARKKAMTKVTNELLEENHNNMDSNPEIQFLVYEKINTALMDAIQMRDMKQKLGQQLIGIHQRLSPTSSLSLLSRS